MRRYKEYKDSGLKWIGEIPTAWESKPLKYIADITLGKMLTPADKGGYILKPYLRSQNIQVNKVDVSDVKEMWFSQSELHKYLLEFGDILVNEGGDIGRTCIWNNELQECYFQNSVNRVKMVKGDSNYYLYHFYLHHQTGHFDSIVNRVSIPHLTKEKLANVVFVSPSLEEQIQIASYLDQKTAQIDKLISDKEKLIDLLNEERTAIINQAVTKGLNPNVLMKDSGIEWLGEIPEHWNLVKLKSVTVFVKTGSTPQSDNMEYFEPQEIEWFTPGDFKTMDLNNSRRKISKKAVGDGKCKVFPANSVFMIGIGATIGKVGLISEAASCNQQINAIFFDISKMLPEYGARFLDNYSEVTVSRSSSATLPIINQNQTKDLFITMPPIIEQTNILNLIGAAEKKFSLLSSKLDQEIQLLKEYKTALISEVVTGKVDVRDGVIQESSA